MQQPVEMYAVCLDRTNRWTQQSSEKREDFTSIISSLIRYIYFNEIDVVYINCPSLTCISSAMLIGISQKQHKFPFSK